ncbi:MAG: MBL fold metallo-hydrolase [Clostridiaceae bacterium]|jgi:glyoxylase-like metal-dependent hydrolase (beta-lactamase superfamily II)|nr:MBL fold metallo-hydrolase [Clostridiaceae bacterium]
MAEIIALPDGHMTAITYLVVLPDQVLLIDPTTPVRHLPPNLPPIRRILATHGHIDHIYQADAWRRLSGAPLAIHDADRDCLTDPGRNLSALISNARTFAPAQETLAHGQVIDLDTAHQLTIWHTPGHTSGSCCFLLDEDGKPRALFSGDTLFAGSVGRTDLGGDTATLMRSLRFLAVRAGHLATDETHDLAVYPGHGPVTGLAREIRSNPYFP